MVAIRIYVEGGGDSNALKTRCREGFQRFFEKAGLKGRMPRVIACGTRRNAYDDFCTALKQADPNEFIVLLVDSEEPVPQGCGSWEHLKNRSDDNWDKPPKAADDNAHLMVQCMEAWFLADKDVLMVFYGSGFNSKVLGNRKDIESIPKHKIL